ncbi:frr [Wigglesworthia glossinidia endosymbiont of Glossina brevipalpis]|uniref:Ribosome-recycling factor n=1 Tax=Wigglesworthia glossinidia brevipalpis TaxID=36870 RepID=RRF_WIGBR|nr:RecName: Full=Ribosome-recycling factor; Short=RRF; AltName: Full=Ribosome-releasing factor [Wigglesworthia glossinidia endosymbiont of Glossina brevipalpis]BAC24535.1 frr [Wigglesworthia glossinidia endosymbiont of Glossina brevipalpis]
MINEIYENSNSRMKKSIDFFKKNISKIRTNRVSPSLIENIYINCYGTSVPLSKLSNILSEKSNILKINVFDNNIIKKIEQAILSSDLGVNPQIQENYIRIEFPKLTEARRFELIKLINKEAEQNIISIRNIRRDANEKIKKLIKAKTIGKDEDKKFQEVIQNLTNSRIEDTKKILKLKEKEIKKI